MRLTLAVLLALIVAGVSAAASPLEDRLAPIASEVAGKPAQVRCYDDPGWAERVGAFGWNPADNVAFVLTGSTLIEAAPSVCGPLAGYIATPPTAPCESTTSRTVTRYAFKWKRVKVRGRWGRKRVRVAVKVKLTEHKFSPCDPPAAVVYAAWTIAHESQHVAGISSEVEADCFGLQATELVAMRLGASAANARRLAEVAALTYELLHKPGYWTPECRNGGTLDRRPDDSRWP